MSRWFPAPDRKERRRKILHPFRLIGPLAVLLGALLCGAAGAAPKRSACAAAPSPSRMQKRWLFVWRDMSDPKEVDRMIARFPRAQADGYNGVAFSYNIPKTKAAELRQAAKQHRLDLVAIVMGS